MDDFLSLTSETLSELNNVSILVRLVLSLLFGALIGADRTRKNRPAGLRTHMLVCMGSALVMITNQYMNIEYPTADPARLGAQVISGIGFLGVGTIIVTRSNHVQGLTTAAGLWASACIGLAIGIGFYSGALIAGLLILFVIVFMQRGDKFLQSRARCMEIYLEATSPACFSSIIALAHENMIAVLHLEVVHAHDPTKNVAAIITLKLPKRYDHAKLLTQLQTAEELVFMEPL